jgi:hypothetical protein
MHLQVRLPISGLMLSERVAVGERAQYAYASRERLSLNRLIYRPQPAILRAQLFVQRLACGELLVTSPPAR